MSKYAKRARQLLRSSGRAHIKKVKPLPTLVEAAQRKNYEVRCVNDGAVPTVGDTELCGPCCFDDPSTENGNW